METLLAYFPNLTAEQQAQFEKLMPLYQEWNEKINVISRKDIENLYDHHVLHSLAIAKVMELKPKADILDLGTGGGFPGIPLAILYPETNFWLVDSIGKKIRVVQEVADALGLKNVKAVNSRVEELKQKFDFVVTRAVAPIERLTAWSLKNIKKNQHLHALPNGILALKGINIDEERAAVGKKEYIEVHPIRKIFPKVAFFEEKAVVYIQG